MKLQIESRHLLSGQTQLLSAVTLAISFVLAFLYTVHSVISRGPKSLHVEEAGRVATTKNLLSAL